MTILSKFKQAFKLNPNHADARLRLQQAQRQLAPAQEKTNDDLYIVRE